MIQAILFDFNGVIINDERLQMTAYQEVLGAHGIDLTEADYFSCLGMHDKMFVQSAFERARKKLTDATLRSVLEEKSATHRKLIEGELPLFPGVVTFLKATSRHYQLCLVSMATREEIAYVLERARLTRLFSVVVTADEVDVCKPAPDCYQHGLEELNQKRREQRQQPLLPQECLVIEDSPPGIQSGKAAGMRTVGLTNTVSADELRSAGAEVVTQSLADWTVDAVHLVFDE